MSSGQILHAAGVRIALQSASNCEERRIEWPYAKDDGSQKDAFDSCKIYTSWFADSVLFGREDCIWRLDK